MIQPLTNPDVLKHTLATHHIRPDKSLGQNFLICEEVIEATLTGLTGGPKHVTELGPGLGTLTQGIIGAGYIVRAIEKDDDFIKILPTVVPPKVRNNLTVIHGDLTEVDWASENEEYSLVGNIPYNITGLIMRRLTSLEHAPASAIFLMQREVAQRLTGSDTDMSLIGLSTALWGTATLLLNVPASCFIPAPAVQSALVLLRPHKTMLSQEKREAVIATSKPFFQAKRKKISTILKKIYKKSDEEIDQISRTTTISRDARPETISAEKWVALCDIL